MEDVKIVLVGAGSQSFGMKTMQNLIWRMDTFNGATICLHDINPKELERTRALAELANKQLAEIPADEPDMPHGQFKIEATLDRKEAFENATFVVSSIEINRYPLWKQDYYVPIEYGSTQIYGENGGPGGFFHAARVIPPVVEIARDVADICPDAWFFNYTNPMIRVCTAVQRAVPKVKYCGLCHEFLAMAIRVKRMFGDLEGYDKDVNFRENFRMTTAGLNHFAFLQALEFRPTGEDLLPRVPARVREHFGASNPLMVYLLEHYGQVPYTEDSHSGEYISWARGIANVYGYNWDRHQASNARKRAEISGILEGGNEFFWWLTPTQERVVDIMKGILNDEGYRELAVNVGNEPGYIPGLPANVTVEVPARVDKHGLHGETITTIPDGIMHLLRHEAMVSDLAVEAALTGDRDTALQALLMDGTIPSPGAAEKILQVILEKQAEYLPQFFPD